MQWLDVDLDRQQAVRWKITPVKRQGKELRKNVQQLHGDKAVMPPSSSHLLKSYNKYPPKKAVARPVQGLHSAAVVVHQPRHTAFALCGRTKGCNICDWEHLCAGYYTLICFCSDSRTLGTGFRACSQLLSGLIPDASSHDSAMLSVRNLSHCAVAGPCAPAGGPGLLHR